MDDLFALRSRTTTMRLPGFSDDLVDTRRLLDEATFAFARTIDFSATVANVASQLVPRLVDVAIVYLVVEDPFEIRLGAVAHADPARAAELRERLGARPVDPGASRGVSRVVRTGKPEIPDLVAEDAPLEDLDRRASMIVPLIARERVLGALVLFAAEAGRSYDAPDLRFVQEYARRAAYAIDNARLYRDAQVELRRRDAFLAVAAHELKTPVTALTIGLEVHSRTLSGRGRRRGRPESARKALDVALGQARRLGDMIGHLLDLSRFACGQLALEPADLDLAALVERVVDGLALAAARSGTALRFDARGPVVGRWDALRLEQVVTNLVANAVKYGRGRPVDVTVSAEKKGAVIRVADAGVGIPPDDLGRIFGAFERAHAGRISGGLRLGLHVAREVVAAHGGSISVESVVGVGSTFTVVLPL